MTFSCKIVLAHLENCLSIDARLRIRKKAFACNGSRLEGVSKRTLYNILLNGLAIVSCISGIFCCYHMCKYNLPVII